MQALGGDGDEHAEERAGGDGGTQEGGGVADAFPRGGTGEGGADGGGGNRSDAGGGGEDALPAEGGVEQEGEPGPGLKSSGARSPRPAAAEASDREGALQLAGDQDRRLGPPSQSPVRGHSPLHFSPKPVFGSFSDKYVIDDLESQLRIKTRELRAAETEIAGLRERLLTAEKDKVQAREVAIVLRDMLSRRSSGGDRPGRVPPPAHQEQRPSQLGQPPDVFRESSTPIEGATRGGLAGAPTPLRVEGLSDPPATRPVSRWSLDSGADFTLPTPPVKGIFRPPPQPPSPQDILGDPRTTHLEGRAARVPHFAQPTSRSSLKRARTGSLSVPVGQGEDPPQPGPAGEGEAGGRAGSSQTMGLRALTKRIEELQKRSVSHTEIEALKREVQDPRSQNSSLAAAVESRAAAGDLGAGAGVAVAGPETRGPGDEGISPKRSDGAFGEEAKFLSALESSMTTLSPLRTNSPADRKSEPPKVSRGSLKQRGETPRPGITSRSAVPLEKKIGRKPTAKETSELIGRAIGKLKQRFRANGIELPLEHLQGNMYALAGQKIHLLVVGGKLSVRTGGGHLDFLAHLSQKRLRISAFAEQAAGEQAR